MREFFRPWRRKIGVLTLVMACLFMAVWVHSFSMGESFWFRTSSHWWEFVGSKDGVILFGCKHDPVTQKLSSMWIVSLPSNAWLPNTWLPKWTSEWEWFGFSSCESEDTTGQPSAVARMWTLPYWSIVIPLTALSAFLLFSKPRQSTSKKIAEPIPDEGGGAAS